MRRMLSMRIPLATLALAFSVTAARKAGSRAMVPDHGGAHLVGVQDQPKPVPFKPEDHVGDWFSGEVRNFVEKDLAGAFEEPHNFYLESKADSKCALQIRVAKKSVKIKQRYDEGKGFIVALITNPSKCKPIAFDLAHDKVAAWYVRYENPTVDGVTGQRQHNVKGLTGLIVLKKGWLGRDEWFPNKKGWELGYCNHTERPNPKDQAFVRTYETACSDSSETEHDARHLSALQLAEAALVDKARDARIAGATAVGPVRKLVAGTDPALWFACGGDCCYGSFTRERK